MVKRRASYPTMAEVPEADKADYVEDKETGVALLDVEESGGFGLVGGGLQTALGKSRRDLAEAQKTIAAHKTIHDAALEQIEELKKKNPGNADVQEKLEAQRKAIVAQHEAAMAERDAQITTLNSQVEAHALEDAFSKATEKFNARRALLRPHVRERMRTRKTKDGKVEVYVVDEHGEEMLDARGNSATPDILVEKMSKSEEYAVLFTDAAPKGSGLKGSDRPAGTQSSQSGLMGTDRLAAARGGS